MGKNQQSCLEKETGFEKGKKVRCQRNAPLELKKDLQKLRSASDKGDSWLKRSRRPGGGRDGRGKSFPKREKRGAE